MDRQRVKEEDVGFWRQIKGDMAKEFEEGVSKVKKSAQIAKEKVKGLSEELKTQQEMSELKSKARLWMAELGGQVYEVSSKLKNPMRDAKVQMMVERIRRLETGIDNLEKRKKKD